jgi:hypothetical protein
MNAERRIAETATAQAGAFTREQAHAAGLTDRQLLHRVRHGLLDRIGSRTFRSPSVPRSLLADLVGVILDVGESWASGPTAAALHGFDGFRLARPFHITVVRGRHVERTGVKVHTTLELPLIDRAVAVGVPVTSGARTLIELARTETPSRLTIALDSGLRDGLYNEDLLHRRIVVLRTKGRYGVPKLLDVIAGVEVIRGGHSWLEREYLRLTTAAGLPKPSMQRVLTRAGDKLVRVDCHYAGTNVVVELLGYRFHRSPAQLRRDAERVNSLVLEGYAPIQFTYEQIAGGPAEVAIVVNTVAAALGVSMSRHTTAGRRMS